MTTIGDISTKDDLRGHLISLREAGIYDIFAQTCLHEFIKKWQKGEADPTSLKTELPEGTIDLAEFMERLALHGKLAQVETKRNANRSTTRNLLKEGFRITQAFCQRTDTKAQMNGQPWYQFARIIVNCLSHDFRLQFRPSDRRQLPVDYNGHSIVASQDCQSLSMPLGVMLALYDEIIEFVTNQLNIQ